MFLPIKRLNHPSNEISPSKHKTQERFQILDLSKYLWFSIFSYLDSRTYFQVMPLISKSLKMLIYANACKLKSIQFTFIDDSPENIDLFKSISNLQNFRNFFATKTSIKHLSLIIKSNHLAYNRKDIKNIFGSLPILNTLKTLKIKTDSFIKLGFNWLFPLFTSLTSLTISCIDNYSSLIFIITTCCETHNPKYNFLKFKTCSSQLPLKKLSISSSSKYCHGENGFSRLFDMLYSSDIEEFSLKIDIDDIKCITEPIKLSSKLKKLKLPKNVFLAGKVHNEFLNFVKDSNNLQCLHFSKSIIFIENGFLELLAANVVLRKLHLLGLELDVKKSVEVFAAVSKSLVEDFWMVSGLCEEEELYFDYLKGLQSALEVSKIKRIAVNIKVKLKNKTSRLNYPGSLAKVIVNQAKLGKLEWFLNYNVKYCIQSRIHFPRTNKKYKLFLPLFFEIFRKSIKKNQNKIYGDISENIYSDFKNKIPGLYFDKTCKNKAYIFYAILAMKFDELKVLDLRGVVIDIGKYNVIKAFKNLHNLETLKILLKKAPVNIKSIFKFIKNSCSLISNLSIEFKYISIWTTDTISSLLKFCPLRKLSLINAKSSLKGFNIFSTIPNIQVLHLEHYCFSIEDFSYFLEFLKRSNKIIDLKLDKLSLITNSDSLAMLDLLKCLENKKCYKSIYIVLAYMMPYTLLDSEIYNKLIQTLRNIVSNNTKLEKFSVLLPVYHHFLINYSQVMLELIKNLPNLRLLNTYSISSFNSADSEAVGMLNIYNKIQDPEISADATTNKNDLSSFSAIMPIIFGKLACSKPLLVYNSILKPKLGKLELNPPFHKELFVQNIFIYTCIEALTDLQILTIGNTFIKSVHSKVLANSISYIPSLIKIQLCDIVIKISRLSWVFASYNLKILELHSIIIQKMNEELYSIVPENHLCLTELILSEVEIEDYPDGILRDLCIIFANNTIRQLTFETKKFQDNSLHFDIIPITFPCIEKLYLNAPLMINSNIAQLVIVCWKHKIKFTLYEYLWDLSKFDKIIDLSNCKIQELELTIIYLLYELKIVNKKTSVDLSYSSGINFESSYKEIIRFIKVGKPSVVSFMFSKFGLLCEALKNKVIRSAEKVGVKIKF